MPSGRRQHPFLFFRITQTLMFLLNSHSRPFHALHNKNYYRAKFSLSYPVILPSSLTMIPPYSLCSYIRAPVSDYITVIITINYFSWSSKNILSAYSSYSFSYCSHIHLRHCFFLIMSHILIETLTLTSKSLLILFIHYSY